jgi:hypothetical protein
MSDNLNQDQKDLINSVKFATEFLKVIRGFKVDDQRTDKLPQEIKEYLANEHLNTLIADHDLEPEMLVWGLVHIIEVLLRTNEISPDELVEVMEKYVDFVKNKPNYFGDDE